MSRYIDADALIAEYDRVHQGPPGGARKLMVEAPTVDVVKLEDLTPCDVCRYNPPSSCDGKSCTVCPADKRG